MDQQPEPVGWWCEHKRGLCYFYDEQTKCDECGEDTIPLYTRTQVRKAFEGLAESMESNIEVDVPVRLLLANEVRRRMEEW